RPRITRVTLVALRPLWSFRTLGALFTGWPLGAIGTRGTLRSLWADERCQPLRLGAFEAVSDSHLIGGGASRPGRTLWPFGSFGSCGALRSLGALFAGV